MPLGPWKRVPSGNVTGAPKLPPANGIPGNGLVKEIPFTGGVYGTPVSLPKGALSSPQSVAVDAL
jgi:hypothetical protein